MLKLKYARKPPKNQPKPIKKVVVKPPVVIAPPEPVKAEVIKLVPKGKCYTCKNRFKVNYRKGSIENLQLFQSCLIAKDTKLNEVMFGRVEKCTHFEEIK